MIEIMPPITFMHFHNHIVNKYHDVHLAVNFRSKLIYWYGEIRTSIIKNQSEYTDPYVWIIIHHTAQYTNRGLESLML